MRQFIERKSEMRCDCSAVQVEIVEQVKELMPSDNMTSEVINFFKVFSEGTRVQIMWALDKADLCVGDIAVLLDMTKSAVSHQLRVLKDSNLVKATKKGKYVFYSFADDHVRKLFETAIEHIEEKEIIEK